MLACLRLSRWLSGFGMSLILVLLLSSCGLSRVSAEERLFLPLRLTFLQELILPPTPVGDYRFGGLSAIAYDRQAEILYALSDARRRPCLFKLRLTLGASAQTPIQSVTVEEVIPLLTQAGEPFPDKLLDPEGLAIAPDGNFILASEGVAETGSPPQLLIFDRQGRLQREIPVPQRYLPDSEGKQGVQSNLGFESLTLVPAALGEPLRVFTAPEAPLVQDRAEGDSGRYLRLLHYLLGPKTAQVVSEQAYALEQSPLPNHGLTELLAIDNGGHFLALERSFGLSPDQGTVWQAKLHQLVLGPATDVSGYPRLSGSLPEGVRLIAKQEVLDLNRLPITVDNLEGLTFGPRLDGQVPTLLVISDDNFSSLQKTQLLVLRFDLSSKRH
jgi:hypothetical protein